MKPLYAFSVSHGLLRLRVEVMDTLHQVNAAFKQYDDEGRSLKKGFFVYAFFVATGSKKDGGKIVLCENTRLFELVPHEVYHAVRYHFDRMGVDDEERIATAVGRLSARILTRMDEA